MSVTGERSKRSAQVADRKKGSPILKCNPGKDRKDED